ncbi:methylmalonate-semialdehyde dehydrogenase (CoA acylating) [Mesorhizobium sp. SARCC-RB16n]|uniref:CoA-acylating methylmalonate-semialdehyde dehydrogenase n=1 Tax=Mesorhizobium sp. SARCC-RB16n TaxID=2116687 RepID=UPI00122F60EF|nr:CoA-acylating methylmalonate-semialdehyde dehydrogenase [Mesorhizobium sp. SARCC-RB16n]KAA3451469.1 methylmalonate-semialdehyde dehydrogenase (CoA acylating) [Mesorhizobium sp. SARCC-RB16n]
MDTVKQAPRYGSHHYINGAFSNAEPSRTGSVFNPSTGHEIYRTAYGDRAVVDDTVQVAVKAGREWANASQAHRLQVIFRMRELMLHQADKIAEITGLESGKTISDAQGELSRALEAIEFATNAPQITKGEYSRNVGGGIDTFSFRQPVGVVGCIAPFNFPVMVPMMMGTMAIAVGNAVVLKPSERVPGASALLSELWAEAGLSAGVWNMVNGDSEVVNAILEHPGIPAISFVGSTRVGEHIYQHGSKHNKRVAAYTGGKNHMVVLPDADLDAAASAFVSAAYGSSSQRCMAVSLLVCVGDETAQKLRDLVGDHIAQLKVGAYDDPSADFGPLVTQAAKASVESAIERAVAEGGEIVSDGRGITIDGHENGFFAGATFIDKVTTDMQLWQDEIFGPVRGMMRAKNLDEAIRIVNAHEYGNGAVIFTRSGGAAQVFCAEVEAGMLGVNVAVPVPVGHHNFGGLRRSKFGDAHMFGPDAARFYTKLKTVSQRWPQTETAQPAKPSLNFLSNG